MNAIHETAAEQGLNQLVLDSQLSAAGFYASLGYEQQDDTFDEVGIPHIKMIKHLATN